MCLYIKNFPRIKPGSAAAQVWRRGHLVLQHQSRSGRYAVTRLKGPGLVKAGPASTVGPAVQSLKPHLVGGGEKNGNTPVSPPQTRCPKPLCSSRPHCAVGTNKAVCPPPLTPVP